MPRNENQIKSGQVVTVTQQIPHGQETWTTCVTGEVMGLEQRKTGSWYAHAKDDKLWLDRLTLRKNDGEIVVINLDGYTQVVIQSNAAETDSTHENDQAQDLQDQLPVDSDAA